MMAGCLCNGDSPLQVVQTQFGSVAFHRRNNPNLILGDVQQNDKMIAHALGQMSLTEREKVYHDIHGVADKIHEEPAFVAERLQEMRDELFQLKSQPSGFALQLAESIDPNYVNNNKFLLIFLRCEEFVVIKAANRMARNLDWKFSLFGASKLCKDIELADLPEEDVKNLKKGYFQLLLERDRAGRAVYIFVQKGQLYPSPESFARVLYYLSLLDEESQKKGTVVVVFYPNAFRWNQVDPSTIIGFARMGARTDAATENRHSVIHLCMSQANASIGRMINRYLTMVDKDSRAKMKIHYGTHTEWIYALMTYGIPHHLIPLTDDGKIKLKNHMEYIDMKRAAEQYAQHGMVETVQLPLLSDVLLGRGRPIQDHAGNMRLKAIVDEYLPTYHTAPSFKAKREITGDIVRMIKEAHGRFLSKDSGVWIEVSDDVAHDKVSHLFRARKKDYTPKKRDSEEDSVGKCRSSVSPDPEPSKRLKT